MHKNFSFKELKTNGDVTFVAISGRLGTSSADEFVNQCQALLDAGCRHIVVDMSGVEFTASSGAGAMVLLWELFHTKDGTVQVLNASGAVTRVVELLNIGRYVTFVSSEAEAIEHVHANRV